MHSSPRCKAASGGSGIRSPQVQMKQCTERGRCWEGLAFLRLVDVSSAATVSGPVPGPIRSNVLFKAFEDPWLCSGVPSSAAKRAVWMFVEYCSVEGGPSLVVPARVVQCGRWFQRPDDDLATTELFRFDDSRQPSFSDFFLTSIPL